MPEPILPAFSLSEPSSSNTEFGSNVSPLFLILSSIPVEYLDDDVVLPISCLTLSMILASLTSLAILE